MNLNETDEVTVILHERSLQIVKTPNVKQYIQVFKKLQNVLTVSFDKQEIESIILSLLKQQFYLQDNEVLDRTGRYTVKLEDAEDIINGVYQLIHESLPLWYQGEYYSFIMQLGITFELDWENFIEEIGERISLLLGYTEENHDTLDGYVVFSMIISKLIYCFREKASLNLLREIKSEYSFIYHDQLPLTKVQQLLSQEASLLLNLRIFEDFHSLLRRNRNQTYQALKKSIIKILNDEFDADLKNYVEGIQLVSVEKHDNNMHHHEGIEFKIPKPE